MAGNVEKTATSENRYSEENFPKDEFDKAFKTALEGNKRNLKLSRKVR